MKLIHCADLHLGSPMEANLSPERVRERRGELLSAFAELVRLADRNGVSAILIAGDLFDSGRIGKKTKNFLNFCNISPTNDVLLRVRKMPAFSLT